MPKNSNGIFRPNFSANIPINKLPVRPPIHSNEITNDASDTVNGPDFNGVSGDCNVIKLLVAHAHDVPYEKLIKLPAIYKFNIATNTHVQIPN